MGLPTFRDSRMLSSSALSSITWAMASRAALRSAGDVPAQPENASVAAATAASMSSGVAAATSAITSVVAGSITAWAWPPAGRNAPPMKFPSVTSTPATVVMAPPPNPCGPKPS